MEVCPSGGHSALEILIRHGGVYADMDTLFVNELPESFFSEKFIMGLENMNLSPAAEAAGGALCNAWIMSERTRLLRTVLERIYAEFDAPGAALHFPAVQAQQGVSGPGPRRAAESFFFYDGSPEAEGYLREAAEKRGRHL